MPPTSVLPTLPVSGTPIVWGVTITPITEPPPPGVSLIVNDGSMITSAPPTLMEGRFDSPNIFHPLWSPTHRRESSVPPSVPPPAVEERRPSTIPPPGVGREKTLGILGRSIHRELRGLGYENPQLIQVAAWFLSLITEMIAADRNQGRRSERAAGADRSGLSEALEKRFEGVLQDLKSDGYAARDLVWIANEILGQVSKEISRSAS